MAALFTMVLAALSAAATASAAHRVGLAHYHLAGGIPMGGFAIGAVASLGVILAIKLSSGYDTAGSRIYAQLGALSAYGLAVLLDYLSYQVRFDPKMASPEMISVMSYAKLLIDQGSAAIVAFMPKWIRLPEPAAIWLGVLRLVVEGLAAIVATGWTISLLTGVPYCGRHRRFYELRHLTESADVQSVRQWETAIRERRPVEARALLTRVRAARVQPSDRSWVRIAVHQCSICQAARVRVEKRRRSFGRVVTEPEQEFVFDPIKGSVLLAT